MPDFFIFLPPKGLVEKMSDFCLRWGWLMKISSTRPSGGFVRALSISSPLCRRVSLKGSAMGPSRHLPTTPSEGLDLSGPFRGYVAVQASSNNPFLRACQASSILVDLWANHQNVFKMGTLGHDSASEKSLSQNIVLPVFSEGVVERNQYGVFWPSFNTPFPRLRAFLVSSNNPFRG